MFKNWKERRAAKKVPDEKIKNDEYLTRLRNSAYGFCGVRHSEKKKRPFLKIREIEALMRQELDRRTKAH